MVAKKITLQTRETPFKTITEANNIYKDLAPNLFQSKEVISSGNLFEELKEIYTLYCSTDKKYHEALKQKSIIGFKGNQTIDENKGKHVTTTCLFVIFSDRTEERFSIKKAFAEIAKLQN